MHVFLDKNKTATILFCGNVIRGIVTISNYMASYDHIRFVIECLCRNLASTFRRLYRAFSFVLGSSNFVN